jgi:hypothetical protein
LLSVAIGEDEEVGFVCGGCGQGEVEGGAVVGFGGEGGGVGEFADEGGGVGEFADDEVVRI